MDDLLETMAFLYVWNEMSNYPPECGNGYCGHEFDQHDANDGPCQECECEEYTPWGEGPDPW